MKLFVIKNKQSGKFFSGFDKKDNPIWCDNIDKATKLDNLSAKCQAQCLRYFGAQLKPVAVN